MIRMTLTAALALAAGPAGAQPKPEDLKGTYRLVSVGGKDPAAFTSGLVYKRQEIALGRIKVDAANYRIEGTYTLVHLDGKDVSLPLHGWMGKGDKPDGMWFGAIAAAKAGRDGRTLTFYTKDFRTLYATEVVVGPGPGNKGGAFYTRIPAVCRFEQINPKTGKTASEASKTKVEAKEPKPATDARRVTVNQPFKLVHLATGKVVSDRAATSRFYYPKLGGDGKVVERLAVEGAGGAAVEAGKKYRLRVLNVSDMPAAYRDYNILTAFISGIGYWNYEDSSSEFSFIVVDGRTLRPVKATHVSDGDHVLIHNTKFNQYLCPAGKDSISTKADGGKTGAADRDLIWRIHLLK